MFNVNNTHTDTDARSYPGSCEKGEKASDLRTERKGLLVTHARRNAAWWHADNPSCRTLFKDACCLDHNLFVAIFGGCTSPRPKGVAIFASTFRSKSSAPRLSARWFFILEACKNLCLLSQIHEKTRKILPRMLLLHILSCT